MAELVLDPLSDPIRVPVGDGTLVAEAGGEGPVVLLLHAGVADRRAWRPLAPHLRGFRLVAHDRRGFGETTSTATTVDHVADTVAVLDHLGVDRALVVGNSMGGAVAQHLALEHPDRVSGLVLAAAAWLGAPHPDDPPELDAIVDALATADAAGDLDEVNRVEAHVWLDGPLQPEGRVSGDVRELFLEMNGRALVLDATSDADEVERTGTWDRLPGLATPTAVVVGDLDEPAAMVLGRSAVDRLPAARLHVLEGVAHLPGLEVPDRLAAIVREVAARVG